MTDSQDTVGPGGLERVKREADFFMEKTFQVSFGYLGALVALVAASGLSIGSEVASQLGLSTTAVFCCCVLVLNACYLALASGMLFATVKRGIYLVVASDTRDGHHAWEFFLRRSSGSPFPGRWWGHIAWNLDNFYMAPLFALIVLVSVIAGVVGLSDSSGSRDFAVVSMAAGIHLVPFVMLLATVKMTKHLEARLEESN